MKQKIKKLIAQFILRLTPTEREISVQDLSIFFSILIATFTLRRNKSKNIKSNYSNFFANYNNEIQLLKERFPELFTTFSATQKKLSRELLIKTFVSLNDAFQKADSDIDDITSWSYQYLKKDLEKAAFKKIGKHKAKIENSDLLFTTQFFTDKYMVKFLVDETLSGMSKKNIQNIVVIDCASGGGNFLNYSFEKLYKSYETFYPKWSAQKIVDLVLNDAILGYDLDNNLSKIASLSLFVKASSYAIPSDSTQIKIYGGLPNDKLGFLNKTVTSNKIGKTTFKSQFEKMNIEGKTKVFVTNPPFMGRRDMDASLKYFLLETFPESKGDLCVSFLQRIIQLMNVEDVLGIVSQNNWMYLSSLKDFRKVLLSKQSLRKCVDLGSNAFEDINGDKTNVALCVVGASKTTKFVNLKYINLPEKRKLVSAKKFPASLSFELNQNEFLKNENFGIYYQLEHRFKNVQHLTHYAEFGNPMQGTSTGNNAEFVKFTWEIDDSSDWKLVSKGGGFSKWAGLNYYKVNWGINAEKIKANKGSALRNIDKMSSTQLVYSDTGTLGLNVRILKENQVFIASGPGIKVLNGNKYAHLAFFNSRVATFLLKLINPKFTISAGYISRIPIAPNILESEFISTRGKKCLALKEKYLQSRLPNYEFQHTEYSQIINVDKYIEELILADLQNDFERLLLESEIESKIKNLYQFNSNELLEIKGVVGESPFFNKKRSLKIDIKKLDLLVAGNIDINCQKTSRRVNGLSMGSESVIEDLSYKLDINPNTIMELIKNNVSELNKTKEKYFNDLLHKIILNELGIKHISFNNFPVVSFESLVDKVKKKYLFLNNQQDLPQIIKSILSLHHKASFFNKPLISLTNESLIVGQNQNG